MHWQGCKPLSVAKQLTEGNEMNGYAISFSGHKGEFKGCWHVHGDYNWRTTRATFDTPWEAEAAAAHSLCLHLNCELYPTLNNRLKAQGD